METVGGYRLVRELGSGARAQVYLGNAVTAVPDAPDRVALKLYRSTTELADIDVEIEALGRASSPHLLGLLDIGSAPDGRPCLILQRLGTRSLARLIADRQSLAPGEAVTVLAPIVEAVAELHRVGVAHGNLRPAAILFDEVGRPVLTGFGCARLVGEFPLEPDGSSLTLAQLADEPRILGDLAQLRDLCGSVLNHVHPPSQPVTALLGWLEAVSLQGVVDTFRSDLLDRLFDLGQPQPVVLSGTADQPVPAGLPARLGMVATREQPAPSRGRAGHPKHLMTSSSHGPVPGLETLLGTADRIRPLLARVKRPAWLGAGIGAGVLVLALLVLPASGSGPARGGEPEGVPAASPTAQPVSDPALSADDPVAAARSLFLARSRCLLDDSVLCLDAVDQPESSAMEADRYLLQSHPGDSPAPAEATVGIADAALVERLGDSALVALTLDQPDSAAVSVLIVKNEAGWRIRDVLVG